GYNRAMPDDDVDTSGSNDRDRRGPDEPEHKRLDRNWNELLQELRVTQTGIQILTAFLLTIPFQSRFSELADYQVQLFLALASGAVLVTILGLTPVILHRRYFRKGKKPRVVAFANRVLQVMFVALGIVLIGIIVFVFDVAISLEVSLIAGAITAVALIAVWYVLPSTIRASLPDRDRHI